MLLSVCAAMALCINLAGSCSADDEDDIYYGDELKTRAKATRSESPETGDGGTTIYAYKIEEGSGTVTSYISQAEDFYATVEFSWTGGETDANVAQVNASASINIPNKTIMPAVGEDVDADKYYIISNSCSNVQKVIYDAAGKSRFITTLKIVYKEIIYNTRGEFYGYGTQHTYIDRVTLDVTDKVERYIAGKVN